MNPRECFNLHFVLGLIKAVAFLHSALPHEMPTPNCPDPYAGKISSVTGIGPVLDPIIRRRSSLFGHVARLPEDTPAH